MCALFDANRYNVPLVFLNGIRSCFLGNDLLGVYVVLLKLVFMVDLPPFRSGVVGTDLLVLLRVTRGATSSSTSTRCGFDDVSKAFQYGQKP